MRITQFCWAPFHGRFLQSFRTSSAGRVTGRLGVIVRLINEAGVVGYGEALPLPERNEGTLGEVMALCQSMASEIVGRPIETAASFSSMLAKKSGGRALAFGLETAITDILGREREENIAEVLAGPDAKIQDSVVVNATIGQEDDELAVRAATAAVRDGFKTIKLKVGFSRNVTDEIRRIVSVRDAIGSDIRLRIDANGSWGLSDAMKITESLEKEHSSTFLEWIEQPVQADDITGLRQLKEASSIAIAADESVASINDVERLLHIRAVDAVILKPMSLGGLTSTREAAHMAQRDGIQVAITTSIDSGIGTLASLHVAASLSKLSVACGLATFGLLEPNLLNHYPSITAGSMCLPQGNGLGVGLVNRGLTLRWSCVSTERTSIKSGIVV